MYIKKVLRFFKHFDLTTFLRVAYKWTTSKTIKKTSINNKDLRHPLFIRLPSSDLGIYGDIFIDKEYDFSLKKSPKVIVDAGANIGLAAIYFANKYPDCKILAIEPEINNYNILKENIAPYKNIIPIQAALWNKNTKITIINPKEASCAFITKKDKDKKGSNKIQAITMDKIIKDYNLKSIDVLKVDIEGAEKEVFEDTSKWINKIDSIIIELHDRFRVGCSRNFYNGTTDLKHEQRNGENTFVSRH